jgi:hypothetical protein
MNPKDRMTVYEKTGARVYYNKIARLWCALWLENGFECKVLFRNGESVESIVNEVTKRRLTAYTFNR